MMKKKILLASILVLLISGISVWYYVFVYSKNHHREVANEKGITVAAREIVKEFQLNEKTANGKYLNKAVVVTGEVSDIKTDQAGQITVTLKSDDTFSNVFCTLKSGNLKPEIGKTIRVKGICNGFLSDVVLNEAILENTPQ